MSLPSNLWYPIPEFSRDYFAKVSAGVDRLRHSSVAFVGLARNCGTALRLNLQRALEFAAICQQWKLHIEANDCVDDTLDVLVEFHRQHRQATFHYQTLERPHCPAEFAGRRTIALAEYRDQCQRWVRACAPESDYVVVVDWDLWGGWNHDGLAAAIGWLVEMQGAYGMASVSLFQHDFGAGPTWAHYDLWALRGLGQSDCYWDTYQNGYGGFAFWWLPPVGSPPVLASSAFGGLAVYRTSAYLQGTYDGTQDCEHVPMHASIARATGQHLYVCPAMRTLVTWMESTDAGHRLDGVPDVPTYA